MKKPNNLAREEIADKEEVPVSRKLNFSYLENNDKINQR